MSSCKKAATFRSFFALIAMSKSWMKLLRPSGEAGYVGTRIAGAAPLATGCLAASSTAQAVSKRVRSVEKSGNRRDFCARECSCCNAGILPAGCRRYKMWCRSCCFSAFLFRSPRFLPLGFACQAALEPVGPSPFGAHELVSAPARRACFCERRRVR